MGELPLERTLAKHSNHLVHPAAGEIRQRNYETRHLECVKAFRQDKGMQ